MSEEIKEQTSSESETKLDLNKIEDFEKASLKDQEAFLQSKDLGTSDKEEDSTEETIEETESSEESQKDQTSDESTEEVDSEEEKESSESESSETSKEDKQKKESLETRFSKLEESYKNLEAEFTRRSQRLKRLEAENETLKAGVSTTPNKSEQTSSNETKLRVIEEMRKDNPDAAKLFGKFADEIISAVKAQLTGDLETFRSSLAQEKAQTNLNKFRQLVKEFRSTPLAPLEAKINEVLEQEYQSDEELVQAVSTNPNLFVQIRDRVIAANYKLAAELEAKADGEATKAKEKQREGEIEKSKGSGKPKTSSPVVKDLSKITDFKKLSTADKEKLLRKKGIFQV